MRKSKLTEEQWQEVERRVAAGESQRALAREFDIGDSSLRETLARRAQRQTQDGGGVIEAEAVSAPPAEPERQAEAMPPDEPAHQAVPGGGTCTHPLQALPSNGDSLRRSAADLLAFAQAATVSARTARPLPFERSNEGRIAPASAGRVDEQAPCAPRGAPAVMSLDGPNGLPSIPQLESNN